MNSLLVGILVISLVMQIVAVSTNNWAKYRPQDVDSGINYGMWKICNGNSCKDMKDINESDLDLGKMKKNIQVIQAFAIIGIVMTAVLIVMLVMNHSSTMYAYVGAIVSCVIAIGIWISKYMDNSVTMGSVASKSVPDWSYWVYVVGVIMLPSYLMMKN